MGYPQKLLANGEEVEFELRPHWRSLIGPVVWLILIVGIAAFLSAKLSSWMSSDSNLLTIARVAIVVVAVFLLIFLFVRPLTAWLTTQYVFTNRRIIIRTGLIARKGRDMPLSKINNVSFEHTVMERVFNSGTLVIESASEHGMLVVANVPNVEQVQREVYRLHDDDDAFRSARAELFEQQLRTGQTPDPLQGDGGAGRQEGAGSAPLPPTPAASDESTSRTDPPPGPT
ncbi:MAG: hypothetical protein RLZ55_1461 [Actinomycetota bacterium]|jgi:uncharacterized membrane protein YdbT with pleckstrin-like domain